MMKKTIAEIKATGINLDEAELEKFGSSLFRMGNRLKWGLNSNAGVRHGDRGRVICCGTGVEQSLVCFWIEFFRRQEKVGYQHRLPSLSYPHEFFM